MSKSDLPDQLNLHVGEERVLELPSLAIAGYMCRNSRTNLG
jgi:hypothetical protein